MLWIALCVGMAPWLSQARTLAHDPLTPTPELHADCPMGQDSASQGTHHSEVAGMHDCCVAWVGIWVESGGMQALRRPSELIPFDPPFGLSSRHEGLFRPPRSYS